MAYNGNRMRRKSGQSEDILLEIIFLIHGQADYSGLLGENMEYATHNIQTTPNYCIHYLRHHHHHNLLFSVCCFRRETKGDEGQI